MGEGERVALGVGDGVEVGVDKLSGVTETRATTRGVGVRVVKRATRTVGLEVGMGSSDETNSPKRQASEMPARTKVIAKNIFFF